MLTEREQKILNLIDDSADAVVETLRCLIGFKTVAPSDAPAEGDDYRQLQELVRGPLDDMGFCTESWEIDAAQLEEFPGSGVNPTRDMSNMPVVVGQLAGAGQGRSLILNGHYDVVPPGLTDNWRHDPFGAVVEDGKVFGRGACDMKGGIAAMLMALRAIQDAEIKLAGDVTVQTVPDEEATSMGTLACCQRGYRADAAIIPEPTDMKVLVAMRGGLYGRITVFGRAGHAEIPQPHWTEGGAVNAIDKAATVIQALEGLTEEWRTRPDKQHKLLAPDMIIPTVIRGGEWEVTYPEEVEISFGCKFIPSTQSAREEIEAHLMRVAALDPWMREHRPRLEIDGWLYGAEIDESEPVVQIGLEVLGDLGFEPSLLGYGTLSDAIHLINYARVPTISIGPSIQPAHMANEYVEMEELQSVTKALALTIMRWCGVIDP